MSNIKFIQKYILGRNETEQLILPVDAQLIHLNMYEDEITLWIMTHTKEKATELREFEILGDNWNVENNRFYVGTVISGKLVWHVFEMKGG